MPVMLHKTESSVELVKTSKYSALSLKRHTKSVPIGTRLRLFTDASTTIDFNRADIRGLIECEILKARNARASRVALDSQCGYFSLCAPPQTNHPRTAADMDAFAELIVERDFKFDPAIFPLKESFASMTGIKCDLSFVHLTYTEASGESTSAKNAKKRIFEGVLDRSTRRPFHELYDSFIRGVVAPLVGRVMPEVQSIYFQSFPCIRMVGPNEFSIGAHADCSYGFAQGNINFYVPLTSIYGTNSLVLESVPGLEDWWVLFRR
jgi:hypothetical protein